MIWFPKQPQQWAILVAAVVLVSIWLLGFWQGVALSGVALALYLTAWKTSGSSVAASPSSPPDGYQRAEYGVPHTRFEQTEDGFKVSFNKSPLALYKTLGQLNSPGNGIQALVGLFIVLPILGIVWVVNAIGGGSHIEVTGDTITINGKKFVRADFGGFVVHSSWKLPNHESEMSVLGYSYGRRSFSFGGAWEKGQATEVASALNSHLRGVRAIGTENAPSPEELREARPSDF